MSEVGAMRVVVPVVMLGIVTGIYLLGRALGVFTLVGYDNEHMIQRGITHEISSSPGFGTPVILRPGEALAAEYEVQAPIGALKLRVHGTGRSILPAAFTYVSGERSGRVLFVASEGGLHGYEAGPTSIKGNSACNGGSVAEHIALRGECPTLDVAYIVSWRWVRADEVARSSDRKAAVPPAGGESTHQEI